MSHTKHNQPNVSLFNLETLVNHVVERESKLPADQLHDGRVKPFTVRAMRHYLSMKWILPIEHKDGKFLQFTWQHVDQVCHLRHLLRQGIAPSIATSLKDKDESTKSHELFPNTLNSLIRSESNYSQSSSLSGSCQNALSSSSYQTYKARHLRKSIATIDSQTAVQDLNPPDWQSWVPSSTPVSPPQFTLQIESNSNPIPIAITLTPCSNEQEAWHLLEQALSDRQAKLRYLSKGKP